MEKDYQQIKKRLHQLCEEYLNERIMVTKNAMEAAQKSANEETKSSVGDKYETSRAMMQQEKDRNAKQLHEALKVQQVLYETSAEKVCSKVEQGSLVISSTGKYYFCISAGKLVVNGATYFAISMGSPIGMQLRDLKVGDSTVFRGKRMEVLGVYWGLNFDFWFLKCEFWFFMLTLGRGFIENLESKI